MDSTTSGTVNTNLRANKSIGALTGELSAEYVKPSDLAGHKVNIVDAYERQGQYGDECCFEVQYIEGEFAGASAIVTLKTSPMRKKLVRSVAKYGSIGPVVLAEVGKEIKGNKPWGFVDANPPAEGTASAQPDLLAPDAGEDDKLPF